MRPLPRNPRQLVFSGGGLRCFWQGGVMDVLCRNGTMAPERVTGVSGGALAAASFLSGGEERLLDEMCRAFEDQDTNVDPFAKNQTGITPHQEIYCEVVSRVIDAQAAEKVAQGPAFQILIAHPPRRLPPKMSGAMMAAAYEAELKVVNAPHFDWAEKMGLEYTLVDARQAARDGKLVDLVCAAAVIPPVFEPPLWDGRPTVDGGMADQAPMPRPDEGDTLILLTRRYRNVPRIEGRTYVAPSDETEADKIDFTAPEKLRATWAQGQEDARRWLEEGLPDEI
ncbi:patatin-like phospholipase family protein [Citreimonas sp.]|uniref:patatin-like phospholipase family protein n=1 Tax=Citreimonas sp. TaxID=3036715 RepID=UPI004058B088